MNAAGASIGQPSVEGQKLGEYILQTPIGKGGNAKVFLAVEPSLHRQVAIKILSDSEARYSRSSFEAECRNVGQLSRHRNIVTVHKAGDFDGQLCIVMDVYDSNLGSLIKKRGRLSIDRTVRTGKLIASALQHAHSHGVIHRDIKPQNILYSGDFEDLVLTDFGIACRVEPDGSVTEAHGLTPAYAAPETINGETPTEQADLYSLGATLYTALNKMPAFAAAGMSREELEERVLTLDLPPIDRQDIPPSLWALLQELMAKDPNHRPRSAQVVVDRLNALDLELNPDSPSIDSFELTTTDTIVRHTHRRPGLSEPSEAKQPDRVAGEAERDELTKHRSTDQDQLDELTVKKVELEKAEAERKGSSKPGTKHKRALIGGGTILLLLLVVVVSRLLVGDSGEGEEATQDVELETPESTTILDLTPLPAPSSLSFDGSSSPLKLEWEAVDGAVEYRVRFLNNVLETQRAQQPSLEIEPPDELDGDLCAQVVAIDDNDRQGRESNAICVSLNQ